MTETSFKVKGLDKLKKALNELPEKVERNVMRGAMRAAGKPVRAEAQRLAAKATGEMAAGIKVTSPTTRGGVVRGGVRLTGKHAWLGRFIEFDVAPHLIRRKGEGLLSFFGVFRVEVQHPGRTGTPFMRPALETQADDAVKAAGEYVRTRLKTKHGIDIPDTEADT